MNRKALAQFLKAVANEIESGDCLGGSITFNAFYGVDQDKNEAEFFAAVRVGNLNGQGGISIFNSFTPGGILKDFLKITDVNIDTVGFMLVPKI